VKIEKFIRINAEKKFGILQKEVNNGKYLKNTYKAFTFSSVCFGGSTS
jgi:hypothetical protein